MRDNITAKWARETATNVLNEMIENQINSCLDDIEEAVSLNKFTVNVFLELHPLAEKDLLGRGFNVKFNNGGQTGGESYTINWQ